MTKLEIDRLSTMPDEILNLILNFCSDSIVDCRENRFIRYEFYPDHCIFQDYQGDMVNGVPHGHGCLYQGRLYFNETKTESQYNTSWIYLPLLLVYPSIAHDLNHIHDVIGKH